MTAQVRERLIYQGRSVSMCTEPLNDYFVLAGYQPAFSINCTALWRGYVGVWEIVNDRLYMVSLEGTLEDGSSASLETIFPGYPDRVFAHWYSGALRIPEGELVEYVHIGYASVYEQDRFIEIENGIVIDQYVRKNDVAEESEGRGRHEA